MSTAARELLAAFDAMPDTDREVVVTEPLTRHPVGAGDIPDETFVELADEVFRMFDAEEAADANILNQA